MGRRLDVGDHHDRFAEIPLRLARGVAQWDEHHYDEFGRLNAMNITQGSGTSFSYIYDRWGNRWQKNAVGGGGGPQPHATFNTNNQIITYAPTLTMQPAT